MQMDEQFPIGSTSWLFKLRGSTLLDNCMLFILKATYRTITRLQLLLSQKGKRAYSPLGRPISYEDFLYKAVEFLGLDRSMLVVFCSQKHGFQFCSRITRNVNNLRVPDVYVSMNNHEDDIVEHFLPKAGETVVDVGAAFGFYTILASRCVGSSGKVISMEPQPDIFDLLKKNILLNNIKNVAALNHALYSSKTILKLYNSYSVIPERAKENTRAYLEIEADTMDNALSTLGVEKVNWIKIDVEGAELEVLKGATKTL